MPRTNETAAKLESAKERLRAALTKLEHSVEKKMKEAREQRSAAPIGDSGDNKASAVLKEKLELTANENKMLKAENEKLAILQAKASKRVEKLIDEVKQVVGK